MDTLKPTLMASLRYFQYAQILAREGSFKRAALVLHISQPALSKGIAALEAEFGTRLFDRNTRPVKPTAAGLLVLGEAERMQQGQEGLKQRLLALRNRSAGRLSIAFGPYAYQRFATRFAGGFPHLHPGVELELTLVGWDAGPRMLQRGEVDLVVGDLSTLAPEDYDLFPLKRWEIMLICHPSHPLAARKPPELQEVFRHPLAHCAAPPWARIWLREHMPDFDYRDSPASLITDDYRLIRDLVLEGEHCALMAECMVARELREKTLISRPLPGAPRTHAGVILPIGAPRSPQVQAAVRLIRTLDEQDPPEG